MPFPITCYRPRERRHGSRDGHSRPTLVSLQFIAESLPWRPEASFHRLAPAVFIMSHQGAFAASCTNSDSYTSPTTPATIAASAKLKTYHWNVQVAAVM